MEQNRISNIILENRSKLSLSGVSDVITFDEETIIVKTDLGSLVIKGDKLHIINFDSVGGDLHAEGEISALVYRDEAIKENFFKKVFK